MKKLVLFAAILVSLSFAACSNKANTEAAAPETENTAEATEEVVAEEVVTDEDAAETATEEVAAEEAEG